jgi:nucleoside 2-deoxyribosyltransferase
MGVNIAPEKCFITDENTLNIPDEYDDIRYQVTFAGQTFVFAFSYDHSNSKYVEDNKYILKGLIINGKFPYDKNKILYDNDMLEAIINGAIIPRSPKEKLDNLLQFHYSLMGYPGQIIEPDRFYSNDIMLLKLYFKNQSEYFFYMSTLKDLGLLSFQETSNKGGSGAIRIKITYKGLSTIVELQEESKLSKNCFIAMSFSDSMIQIRESIKDAVVKCNYIPILVDEIPIKSDVTINDAIIGNLKRSKFVIADFTEQKAGVYFESGFALGQGKQVIYVCSEEDFKNIHFDTNHYPHIKYKNQDDLKEKLIQRIEAWIE